MSSGVGDRPDPVLSRTYSTGKPKPNLSKLRQPSQSKLQTPSTKTKSKTGSNKSQIKTPSLQHVANDSTEISTPRPIRRNSGLKAPSTIKSSAKTASSKTASSKGVSSKGVSSKGVSSKPTSEANSKSPTPRPPRRSAPPSEPRAKPRRTGTKSQTNSPAQSDAGPVAPPRSGAGIKRSVTARQSTSKSLAAVPPPSKTKVCKHPSLEMERSISSESTISSESMNSRNSRNSRNSKTSRNSNRTPTGRTVKTRQPSTSNAPDRSNSPSKRTLKRPSNRSRPSELDLTKRARSSDLPKGTHAVKYVKAVKSKDTDSIDSKSQDSRKSKTQDRIQRKSQDRIQRKSQDSNDSKSQDSLESKSQTSIESKSQESFDIKKEEESGSSKTNRGSLPSVIISPSELLLNQSLHNKLSQNQSNRHGFYLTDTDASALSGGSSEFMSAGECSDHEIVLTSADLKLNLDDIDRSRSTISSCDLVSSDTDLDYDEVADCARQDLTPVRHDYSAVLRRDIVSQISSASTLNDLSDPNRSPSLNITLDEYGYSEDLATPVQNTPSLLHSIGMIPIPTQQPISDQDWNNKDANGMLYNSPDDNFQEPKTSDKELYYDSSDLNLDGSSSEEVDKELNSGQVDKEFNSEQTVDKELNSEHEDKELNSEQVHKELNTSEQDSSASDEKSKNNTVEQNMYTSFLDEKAVSTEEKDVEIKLSDNCETSSSTDEQKPPPSFRLTVEPNDTRAEDVITPLISDTADPLSILAYSQYGRDTPPFVLFTDDFSPDSPAETNSAPSSVVLPKKFPDDPIYFTRNQRSIRPSKRKSVLIRSSSLDKKFMTQSSSELMPSSADSFDSDSLYIVNTLPSCSPISISERDFLSARTPEILITEDKILECLDQRPDLCNTPRRRFILRNNKQRHDVTRRFSETQVFKHHKEKYMKRKEIQEKYSSCPMATTPELKIDSPKYIRTLVKRVSSMFTPTSKSSVSMKNARDIFGSTSSLFINFDGPKAAAEARSLHDDSTDNNSSDRLHRSNSLELADDHASSIRRTHSEKEKHETESSEYPSLSSKAKSISEQLERVKFNLKTDDGIPTLEFQNWTELLPESVVEAMGKKEQEQQHHIWELVTTEHSYITTLSTIINSLLGCLKELHAENFLTKINEHDVFLNIEKIREVHLTFWNECIVPLIQTAKDLGEPLNPEILTAASTLFEEELNPLFEYCIKYIESRSYVKSQQHKNNDFKEYINWCSNQIRLQHNKLGIDEMLIKPIQRIQKYPLLIKDILKKTMDDDTRTVLSNFLDKVRVFVELLNRRKEEKEEQQKIEGIMERIESYSVLPTTGSQTNEQINQILSKYNKLDLAEKVPLLNTQRKFLHENTCKMSATSDSKAQDVLLFLFSDHILVTRPTKSAKKKNKIIKQPLTLDRVVIEELKDASHTNLLVYLNEYGSLVDMFLLSSNNQESHTTLFNAVIQAKDNYIREKNKLYTELDASKSVSTCSVNSAGNHLASPCITRHPLSCSITRSSSEHYPPTRRVQVDTASSVSRAQSMPASNEKRHLLPPTMSSASSSASSSSSSVSEHSIVSSDSSKPATLSEIKESEKSQDSTEDPATVVSQTDNIKTFDDVYISDNLSTEFKGKLDMNKNICDSVSLTAQPDKMLFSKSDAIFIDHHNHQSES